MVYNNNEIKENEEQVYKQQVNIKEINEDLKTQADIDTQYNQQPNLDKKYNNLNLKIWKNMKNYKVKKHRKKYNVKN